MRRPSSHVVGEIQPSLRDWMFLFDKPTLERILPSKSSRIEPLNPDPLRRRSPTPTLTLTLNPLGMKELGVGVRVRVRVGFVGRVGYFQISLREMAVASSALAPRRELELPE